MASADQHQPDRNEGAAIGDTENHRDAGEREQQEEGQPISKRQHCVNRETGERQRRQAQERGAFDLKLP